jgi:hypothetical protein
MLRGAWGSIPCISNHLVSQATSSIRLIDLLMWSKTDGNFAIYCIGARCFIIFLFLIQRVSLKESQFIYLIILRFHNSFKSQDEKSGRQFESILSIWLAFFHHCNSSIDVTRKNSPDSISSVHCIGARWYNNLSLMTYPQVWNRSVY